MRVVALPKSSGCIATRRTRSAFLVFAGVTIVCSTACGWGTGDLEGDPAAAPDGTPGGADAANLPDDGGPDDASDASDLGQPDDDHADAACLSPDVIPGSEGSALWSQSSSAIVSAVAVDTSDAIVITGQGQGDIELGGTTVEASGAFVARLDADGHYLWGTPIGEEISNAGVAIATDPSNAVIVVVRFVGTIDFGGGPLYAGYPASAIVKFDENGSFLWNRAIDNGDGGDVMAVRVLGNGDIVLGGAAYGPIDCGGGPLAGDGWDVFAVRLDGSGTHLWSRRFVASGNELLNGMAVDPDGNILLAGQFQGSVDFGGSATTSASQSGLFDGFVAKLAPSGDHAWTHTLGRDDLPFAPEGSVLFNGRYEDVATDADGFVLLTGDYLWIPGDAGTGADSSFVEKLDADGHAIWQKPAAGPFRVSADGSGNVILGGTWQGTENLDVFVGKLDSDGAELWSRRFGDCSGQQALCVAADSQGSAVIGGQYQGVLDFGNGSLEIPSPYGLLGFLAKTKP